MASRKSRMVNIGTLFFTTYPNRSLIHDIYVFLKHKLKPIGQNRALGADWSREQVVIHLTQEAAGLFVWAATVCRFVNEGRQLAARRLLSILQGDASTTKPEVRLNEIYLTVLKSCVGQDSNKKEKDIPFGMLRETLGAIAILFSPLSAVSLAELLHVPKEYVDGTLECLHSILDVPKDSSRPIRLHHPSLRDFLLDQQRCRDPHFRVDEKKVHEILANRCIQ